MELKDFIPGYFQGITRVIISYPFDYVRLFLQTNNLHSYKDFFNKHSFFSLYRGVSLSLFAIPIDRAIQFRNYEYLNSKNINPFISGAICGVISPIYMLPFNYITNKYILDYKKTSIVHFIKNIDASRLYNGFKPELFRNLIGSSVYMGTYGCIRNNFPNEIKYNILNGAVSGITVWTITYPLDTIKVDQQVNNKNLYDTLYYRIKNYGFLNLWKGILPIYIKTLPSSIGGILVYEQVREFLHKNN